MIITDLVQLKEAVEYFLTQPGFSFDFESMGEDRGVPTKNRLVWASFATDGMSFAVPFGHPIGDKILRYGKTPRVGSDGKTRNYKFPIWEDPPEQLRPSEVFEVLKPLFFSDQVKVGHGMVFDLISVMKYYGGKKIKGPFVDTIIVQWLIDENIKKFGLKELTKRDYGVDYDQEHVGREVEKHPFTKVGQYAELDAVYTWIRYKRQRPLIAAQDLEKVFGLEMDILNVLVDMRLEGAPVDKEALLSLQESLEGKRVEIEAEIYRAAGREFNINSVPQKQQILFGAKNEGGQALRPFKMTKNDAPSTDKSVLEAYSNNPVAAGLIKYSVVDTLLGTYVERYLHMDESKEPVVFDGKIHADLVQYGTVTGRFSCRDPNLQNIPRPGTEFGKAVRGLFVAPEGHQLVVADYGQIELVILAHYVGKGALFDGFFKGIDPHTMTAAMVLGKKPEDVTGLERQHFGKSINFAVVYGAGVNKVAAMANTDTKTAKEILAEHARQFPEIYKFKNDVINTCRTRKPPHVKTIYGRKRRLPTIHSRDDGLRMYAERQAVNSLIQGSAADIIKLAMVDLNKKLPEDMKLILSVHDEIVTTVPTERSDLAVEIVKEAMEGSWVSNLLTVPLHADIKVVTHWSEAK